MKKVDKEIAEKVEKLLHDINNAKKRINKKEEELKKLQKKCNHTKTIHYPRATAECDSWDECQICKAIIYT